MGFFVNPCSPLVAVVCSMSLAVLGPREPVLFHTRVHFVCV